MEAVEAIYNVLLSMFICAVFMLAFLSVLFLAQGLVYAVRWVYDRRQWIRWFNRQY